MDFFETVKEIEIFISIKIFFLFFILNFSEKQCGDRSSSPATLGLHNMLGKNEICYFYLFI